MPDIKKLCIFCGGGPLSKEHIVPNWLGKKHFKSKNTDICFIESVEVSGNTKSDSFEKKKFVKKRQGNLHSRTIRIVCVSCNNGWMSSIDEKAKPIINDLFFGLKRMLTSEDQRNLSAWISLKTIINEYSSVKYPLSIDDVVTIPQSERTFLMENKVPSLNWLIQIYRLNDENWSQNFFHYVLRIEKKTKIENGISKNYIFSLDGVPNTQSTTFGVGNFLFHAASSFDGLTFTHDGSDKIIWPPANRSVIWPDVPILDGQAAKDLSMSLYRKLVGAGVYLPPL